jgi:hypothetical protein
MYKRDKMKIDSVTKVAIITNILIAFALFGLPLLSHYFEG